ncbi:MAG: DUF962 domain-containing protein [Betaproteobacteria bacterium]|nr:DUF962 domain-containing protein [Betaproteobacteria bacterium]
MDKQYKTFRDFYPYYLSEHTDPTCRTLHFIGSWLVLGVIAMAIWSGNAWWFVAVPLVGYGFAWVGHFFFEKNRPATFTYPLYSFAGDWVMFFQLLTGKIPFNARA